MPNFVSFSEALIALKEGKRVCRDGWNGKNMSLAMMPGYGSVFPNETTCKAFGCAPEEPIQVRPYIAMQDASGAIVPGWIASQTDLLADDWLILN